MVYQFDPTPYMSKKQLINTPRTRTLLNIVERVLKIVPEAFFIGGSAIHLSLTDARSSNDIDLALQDATIEQLESISCELDRRIPGYKLYKFNYKNPNLLASVDNVKVSITRFSRFTPIELETLPWNDTLIRIPTNSEFARMKAATVVNRDKPRDYIDLIYLHEHASIIPALRDVNRFYNKNIFDLLTVKLANPNIIVERFNEINWTKSRNHYTKEQLFKKIQQLTAELL